MAILHVDAISCSPCSTQSAVEKLMGAKFMRMCTKLWQRVESYLQALWDQAFNKKKVTNLKKNIYNMKLLFVQQQR